MMDFVIVIIYGVVVGYILSRIFGFIKYMNPIAALVCSILTICILGCVMSMGTQWRTPEVMRDDKAKILAYCVAAFLLVGFYAMYSYVVR